MPHVRYDVGNRRVTGIPAARSPERPAYRPSRLEAICVATIPYMPNMTNPSAIMQSWGTPGAWNMGGPAMMSPAMMSMLMMNPYALVMLSEQMLMAAQQHPPQYPMQAYNHPPCASTGMTNAFTTEEGTMSRNPGYGPALATVPDFGTGASNPEYATLKKFANEHGTLDGTFVTPHTSLQQDQANLARLSHLIERQADDVGDRLKHASPQERAAVEADLKKADAELAKEKAKGVVVSSSEQALYKAQRLDNLYKRGLVGKEVGESNRHMMEMLDMENRADANEFLKFGVKPPAEISMNWLAESPFNSDRKMVSADGTLKDVKAGMRAAPDAAAYGTSAGVVQ